MKTVLKGPVSYTSSQPLNHPDIEGSIVDGILYTKNKLTVKRNMDGTSYFVYHMYDAPDIKYSGRWYQLSMAKFTNVDPSLKTVTYIAPEYEDSSDMTIKTNVPIVIQLTAKGWDALNAVMGPL